VPFSDGRSLISQESGQDLVPVENEMVSAEGHDKNLEQEEKGTCITVWAVYL